MIVIFVPSPPHLLLLFSRVSLALPLPVLSSPARLACVPGHRHLRTISVRGPCVRERKRETFLSLSFSLAFGDEETRRDKEDSEIPSRPVYSLLSLDPAHRRARARESRLTPTSLSACHSPSYRSFLPRPSKEFSSIRPKVSRRSLSPSCLVFQRVRRKAHRRAPLLADRGPRYLCTSYTNGDNNRNFRRR